MARSTWGGIRNPYGDMWEIRYTDKYGEPKSDYLHGTRSDAERRRAELRIEHEGASPNELCKLDQFWEYTYHPEIVEHLPPKTVEGYEQKYRHDIKPVFGGLLLEEIRPRGIQNWICTMPPSTARHAKAVLSAMLSRAFALEYAEDNPAARRFILPKTKPKRDKLTFDELKEIAFACPGEPWEVASLAPLSEGCRDTKHAACRLLM